MEDGEVFDTIGQATQDSESLLMRWALKGGSSVQSQDCLHLHAFGGGPTSLLAHCRTAPVTPVTPVTLSAEFIHRRGHLFNRCFCD